ncbi:uncharacterized protein [Clytia hemisphaerica]|uniref:uncharacterized protein isoform X2 n=1 Tax=Clytia hemisphaerica TaxID=252671 RepID=UPI0034D77E96
MSPLRKRARRSSPYDTAMKFLFKDPKEGLEIRLVDPYKGRGVFATKNFQPGDFLCCYRGNLSSKENLRELEKQYEKEDAGSFVFEFDHQQRKLCIDATSEDGSLGRLINDSKYFSNAYVRKLIDEKDNPHLGIFARSKISVNEEITYFYGEDDLPWHEEEKTLYEELRKDDNLKFVSRPTKHLKIKDEMVDKKTFYKLMCDIEKPIFIIQTKIEPHDYDEVKQSWLIPLESTKLSTVGFDDTKEEIKEEKLDLSEFSPILFGTLNSPLNDISDNELEENKDDVKDKLDELNCTKEEDPLLPMITFSEDENVVIGDKNGDGDNDEIDYHCIKNRISAESAASGSLCHEEIYLEKDDHQSRDSSDSENEESSIVRSNKIVPFMNSSTSASSSSEESDIEHKKERKIKKPHTKMRKPSSSKEKLPTPCDNESVGGGSDVEYSESNVQTPNIDNGNEVKTSDDTKEKSGKGKEGERRVPSNEFVPTSRSKLLRMISVL